MLCPICHNKPIRLETKYGIRNSCCNLWSWGEDEPLVDEHTHNARKAAHKAFDLLWKSGKMRRTDAYKWLATELGLSKELCHIKKFDVETCVHVCILSEKKIIDIIKD